MPTLRVVAHDKLNRLSRGSGAVESLGKQLQRRLRGCGQIWSSPGFTHLLRLCVLIKNKDDSLLWCRTVMALVRDGEGDPNYGIGMLEDITNRKYVEEELMQRWADVHPTEEPVERAPLA